MSSTQKFPDLNLSPSKLRLNYTLGCKSSKSTKSTKSKQISMQTSETPLDSQTRRISLSPKKSSQVFLISKIAKLEEELDEDEINLKLNEVQTGSSVIKSKSEQEIYSKYLEKMIQKTSKLNPSLARCLERGWKGFKRSLIQPSSTPEAVIVPVTVKPEVKTFSSQVSEELLVERAEEEIEFYINHLHRAITRISQMQMEGLIIKLHELAFSLRPVDIPSASQTPEVEDFDLQETFRNITSKIQERFLPKKKQEGGEVKIVNMQKATQTWMKADDLRIVDTYKANLSDKDFLIADLNLQIKRKEEIEEVLRRREREIDDLKRDFLKLRYEDCPSCAAKKKQLEKYNSQLKELQMTVNKGLGIEKELDETKRELVESVNHISFYQKKIKDLTDNLQDVTAKYEEARAQREKIQKMLNQEESLRKNIENQIQNQAFKSSSAKKVPGLLSSAENELENSENPSTLNRTLKDFLIKKSSSLSPDKKRMIPKEKLTEKMKTKSKRETIMMILGISKEEYLSLSKKARLEIFLALLQHTKRCGADCEHLRRAMMIRYKDKGPLFPTKKYNIV
jgi:hypothetical protein